MKHTRTSVKAGQDSNKGEKDLVEVLYQKLGDRWFAFSLINDEVFVGSITQSELEAPQKVRSKNSQRLSGTS